VQKEHTRHGFGAQVCRDSRPGLLTTAYENGGARTRAAGVKGIKGDIRKHSFVVRAVERALKNTPNTLRALAEPESFKRQLKRNMA
jgi:hypothetical protein